MESSIRVRRLFLIGIGAALLLAAACRWLITD
jgi:hypothetical protein